MATVVIAVKTVPTAFFLPLSALLLVGCTLAGGGVSGGEAGRAFWRVSHDHSPLFAYPKAAISTTRITAAVIQAVIGISVSLVFGQGNADDAI